MDMVSTRSEMPARVVFRLITFFLLAGLLAVGSRVGAQSATPTSLPDGPTLRTILARGQVGCGINRDLPGFGYLNPNTGDYEGLDIDLCRAVAAAVFGDVRAVRFQVYASQDEALRGLMNGDVEVLFRNMVVSLSLDVAYPIDFGPVMFYNGQTLMVRADSRYKDWPDLAEATICLAADSPTSSSFTSLNTTLKSRNVAAKLQPAPSFQEAYDTFNLGRCDAVAGDRVTLEVMRQKAEGAANYRVWDQVGQLYTNEPFAPVYRHGDDQWGNIIRWTVYGLIHTERLNITRDNISPKLRTPNESDNDYVRRVGSDVSRLLDKKFGIGGQLGLPNDFMAQVIISLGGNYGEIYERNLGPNSGRITIVRSLNNLPQNGGVLYAPDWR